MKFKSPPTPTIEVRNLQRKVRVNIVDLENFAQKAATQCLRLPQRKKTDLEQSPAISVLLVSDRRMTALHRRYMNQSGPTDVITFQHGEIFIDVETAVRNARAFGNTLGRELRLYIVHGLLHLHAFDDRDETSTRKMRLVEKKILTALK
jgi:probable rRNA maturation factor